MLDECKELGKLAKAHIKEDPDEAVEFYLESANCFDKNSIPKESKSQTEKAAKLLWDIAKSMEDPNQAETRLVRASDLFKKIGKESDSEKALQDIEKSYIESAKNLRSNAGKMDDIDDAVQTLRLASEYAETGKDVDLSNDCWIDAAERLKKHASEIDNPVEAEKQYNRSLAIFRQQGKSNDVEKVNREIYDKYIDEAKSLKNRASKNDEIEKAIDQLKTASSYALKGENQELSIECWVDAGDLIRKHAEDLENPRQAYEKYKEAIGCFRKANNLSLEIDTFADSAEKFYKRATSIHKSGKGIIYAVDNFSQAHKIYSLIKDKQKIKECEEKISEISELVGMASEIVLEQLEEQGFSPISLDVLEQTEKTVEPVWIESPTNVDTEGKERISPSDPTQIAETEAKLEKLIESERVVTSSKPTTSTSLPTPGRTPEDKILDMLPDIDSKKSQEIRKRIKEDINNRDALKNDKRSPTEIQEMFNDALEKQLNEDITDEKVSPITQSITTPPVQEKTTPSPPMNTTPQVTTIPQSSEPEEYTPPKAELPVVKSESVPSQPKAEEPVKPVMEPVPSQPKMEEPVRPVIESRPSQEKVVDQKASVPPTAKEIEAERESTSPISPAMVDLLRKQGYVGAGMIAESELIKVPEYQILWIIMQKHPISLEDIEQITDLDSVSLPISNLQADRLIEQTNDYQWTIAKTVKDTLMPSVAKESEASAAKPEPSTSVKSSISSDPLVRALEKFGTIRVNMTPHELSRNAEYNIIKTIRQYEPVGTTMLTDLIPEIPPVQLMRIMSRLEVDGLIKQFSKEKYSLTEEFNNQIN